MIHYFRKINKYAASFYKMAQCCENIKNTPGILDKKEILNSYYKSLTNEQTMEF